MSRVKRHKIKKSAESRAGPKKPFMSKQMIWTIIIGGLMILSVFGIMFSSFNAGTEDAVYGDYTFKRTQLGWTTEIDGKEFSFDYLPSDLEELNISEDITAKFIDSSVFYMTFDPEAKNIDQLELTRFKLSEAFSEMFGKYVLPGITKQTDVYDLPVVDCTNATAALPVIRAMAANDTRIYLDEDCIIIEAYESAGVAVKDRILYAMLGIME